MLNVLAMRRSILANALLEGFERGLRSTGVPREARMRLVAGSVGRLMAEGYFAGYVRGAETGYGDGMTEGRREIIHSAAWIKFGPIAASRVTELFERSAYAVGRVVGRESAIHALTAARFGPETADRVVELAGSIDEVGYHSGMGISTAARIGICVLTSATADDLMARVREVIEEESNRAGWADAARELVDHRDDGLLDDAIPTVFDESEWEWE